MSKKMTPEQEYKFLERVAKGKATLNRYSIAINEKLKLASEESIKFSNEINQLNKKFQAASSKIGILGQLLIDEKNKQLLGVKDPEEE